MPRVGRGHPVNVADAEHDHSKHDEREGRLNLTELAAFVALIVDDAEYRFGPARAAAQRDAYAREAVFDLWLTRPGLTVSTAHHALRHVRAALMRRASSKSLWRMR